MRDSDWRLIYELYQNPNITKVAGILFKTQSAVTKRLQAIEDEFGVLVAERTPSGLVFTEEGKYLAERASIFLDFEKKTREGLDAVRSGGVHLLRIGSSYTFNKYLFPSVMKQFVKDHPTMRYTVLNKQSDILYRLVLAGSVDAAFVQGGYINGVNHIRVARSQARLLANCETDLESLPKLDRIGYQTSGNTGKLLSGWWSACYGRDLPSPIVNAGYVDFAIGQLSGGDNRYLICFLPDNWMPPAGIYEKKLFMPDGSPLIRETWFIYGMEKRRSWILDRFAAYIEKNFKC